MISQEKYVDLLAKAAIYVCIEECGATSSSFDGAVEHDFREWRFIGALGFGGKLWRKTISTEWGEGTNYSVSCYPEDYTPERIAMMAAANARLAKLHEEEVTP